MKKTGLSVLIVLVFLSISCFAEKTQRSHINIIENPGFKEYQEFGTQTREGWSLNTKNNLDAQIQSEIVKDGSNALRLVFNNFNAVSSAGNLSCDTLKTNNLIAGTKYYFELSYYIPENFDVSLVRSNNFLITFQTMSPEPVGNKTFLGTSFSGDATVGWQTIKGTFTMPELAYRARILVSCQRHDDQTSVTGSMYIDNVHLHQLPDDIGIDVPEGLLVGDKAEILPYFIYSQVNMEDNIIYPSSDDYMNLQIMAESGEVEFDTDNLLESLSDPLTGGGGRIFAYSNLNTNIVTEEYKIKKGFDVLFGKKPYLNGEPLFSKDALTAGEVSFTVSLKNNTDNDLEAIVLTILNKNGVLKKLGTSETAVQAGAEVEISGEEVNDVEADELLIMVFDKNAPLIPVSNFGGLRSN